MTPLRSVDNRDLTDMVNYLESRVATLRARVHQLEQLTELLSSRLTEELESLGGENQ